MQLIFDFINLSKLSPDKERLRFNFNWGTLRFRDIWDFNPEKFRIQIETLLKKPKNLIFQNRIEISNTSCSICWEYLNNLGFQLGSVYKEKFWTTNAYSSESGLHI